MAEPLLGAIPPPGVPASRRWLLAQGLTVSRLDNALKSEKLVALTTGLYARPDLPVGWQGVVFALQREHPDVVIGGLSTFELLGKGHYVPMAGAKEINVFAPRRPPAWLQRLSLNVNIQWHGTARLWRDGLVLGELCTQTYQWREDLPPMTLSRPERALLEVLSLVPQVTSFELADNLFQGLTSLSPGRMTDVLQGCTNVKAKRLFFWLASRYDYSWATRLAPEDFDLGSGKRVIAPGGKLDTRFLITVPENLHGAR